MEKIPSDNSEKTAGAELSQQLYDDFLSRALHSKEYSDLMDPMIRRIDEDQVASINDSFLLYGDYRVGYKELVELLANTLGIEAPSLYFKTVPEKEKSKYSSAIYDDKKKCIGIVLSDSESYWGTGKIIGPVRKIAHEMWHAYQHSEIEKNGKRASLYQNNFDNYIRANRNSTNEEILAYLEQPIEAEAYAFGEKFTIGFVEKLIGSLTKERDGSIGKTALNNSAGVNQDDEDEDFFNSEYELKMDQLNRLQKIYNNSRFARLTNK